MKCNYTPLTLVLSRPQGLHRDSENRRGTFAFPQQSSTLPSTLLLRLIDRSSVSFRFTELLPQLFKHRPSRGVEGGGEVLGVFAAGLGHVGLAAAAAADDLGGRADPFAGVQPALF